MYAATVKKHIKKCHPEETQNLLELFTFEKVKQETKIPSNKGKRKKHKKAGEQIPRKSKKLIVKEKNKIFETQQFSQSSKMEQISSSPEPSQTTEIGRAACRERVSSPA